jgi:SAM-dependent methyltransferase
VTAREASAPNLADFLRFERDVFGDRSPIAEYDPYLIRYGEYRFVLDTLGSHSLGVVLDLGCESNIFMLFLALNGARVVGIDIDPELRTVVEERVALVQDSLDQTLDVRFEVQDATELRFEPNSVDTVVAVSSIEHMFSTDGNGDQLAVDGIAHALKPGGLAAITLPMSNGAPFHESRTGDARFGAPYRLYTPETLRERIASHPSLETVRIQYLVQRTPDPRFGHGHFIEFWTGRLTEQERLRWAWANPILQGVFNPAVDEDEALADESTVNTALVCLRKR